MLVVKYYLYKFLLSLHCHLINALKRHTDTDDGVVEKKKKSTNQETMMERYLNIDLSLPIRDFLKSFDSYKLMNSSKVLFTLSEKVLYCFP
jgi:hypothetical protein